MFFKPGIYSKPNSSAFANLVSLLHMDGPNGSFTFTDETGMVWGISGTDAQITTSEFVYGGASGSFTNGRYVTPSTPQAGYAFGTNDLTIEMRVRFTDGAANRYFFGLPGASPNIWMYRQSSNGELIVHFGGSTFGTGILSSLNTWYAIAISRVSGTLYIFIDGVLTNSNLVVADFGATNRSPTIGHAAGLVGAPQWHIGQVDEYRCFNGVGLYTSSYTPTGPFPNP